MTFARWTRHLPTASGWVIVLGLLLLPALVPEHAAAYQGAGFDAGSKHDVYRALGINGSFGRWNTTVKLVYDPDGAPAQFTISKMQGLILQAAAQWEQVCGIKFQLVATDANAPDDAGLPPNQQDGLVRIFWAKSDGFAGLAGPDFGNYDQNLGYYPYYDGDLKLNDDPSAWHNDLDMVSTLAHEYGHLIGLGHSENPFSIMYANPYNNLNYPREDDISAAQVLYGVGPNAVDPVAGVNEWRYPMPPVAPASVTEYLFKANQLPSPAAFLSLQSAASTAINAITDATVDGQYVRLNSGGIGNFSNNTAINLKATLVVIDPDGYLWSKVDWPLTCSARTACGGASVAFARTEVLKSYTGTWKILVVDEAAGTLLLTQNLKVATVASFNAAPVAMVSAVQGATPARVTITIAATDIEKQNITVIWHLPGKPVDRNGDGLLDTELSQPLGINGSVVQTVDFSVAGVYTMFVDLRDSGTRYDGSAAGSSGAGEGFSNLLRLSLNLPLAGANGGLTVLAQHNAGDPGSLPVLRTVAAAQSYQSTSTAGATTAGFLMGASKDSGLSTATSFKSGTSILVGGTVQARTADLNKAAGIYVVIKAVLGGQESWLFRDSKGAYRPWSLNINDLQPALLTSNLQSSAVVEVYKGVVGAGTFQVFVGYKLDSSTALHYSSVPLQLNVTN